MRDLAKPCLLALCLGSLLSISTLVGQEPAAHPSSAEVKKAVSEVIDAQLAAFRGGDYPKAYTFASSEIQAQLTPADFEAMVKGSYPVIARSSSADFGAAMDTGEEAIIEVHVVSSSVKREAQFRYRLHQEDGGKWRITGVIEVKPTGLTV